jgi:hypothetical protein
LLTSIQPIHCLFLCTRVYAGKLHRQINKIPLKNIPTPNLQELPRITGTWVQDYFSLNFINKMCIYNVYEPVWHASLWNKRLYELCPIFLIQLVSTLLYTARMQMIHLDVFPVDYKLFINHDVNELGIWSVCYYETIKIVRN